MKDKIYMLKTKIEKLYLKYGSKKNIVIATCGLIIIMVIMGYGYGMKQGSKDRVINGFEEAVISKNKRGILKYAILDSKDIKLNSRNIEPFMDYISLNPGDIKSQINMIRYNKKDENKNSIIKLECRKKLLGCKYVILISPIYINITTNLKDMEVCLNGKVYCKTPQDNYAEKIGPLVPGVYNIEGTVETNKGKIKDSKKGVFLDKENQVIIRPKASKISLSSNYNDAKVFINGKNIGKTVKEFKNVGPVPMDGSLKLYIEGEYPWGKVKSKEIEIKELSDMRLEINPVNEGLKEDLNSILKGFYDSAYEASWRDDKDIMKDCSESVKNKFLDMYKKPKGAFKEKYSFRDLSIEDNSIEVKKQNSSYIINFIVEVTYSKEKNFYGIPYGGNEEKKRFENEVIFNTENKRWKVTKINL